MGKSVAVDIDDARSDDADDMNNTQRVLSLGKFVFVAFFLTSGGPFGLEPAVQSGGVMLTLIGLVVLPIIWGIPQSLMTAELCSMMTVNGGSLLWVWRGLGNLAGVVNAYNSLASALVDLCLYPNLIVPYIPFEMSELTKYGLKVLILLLVTMCNAVGLDIVGSVSIILLLGSMTVFMVEIPWAVAAFDPASFMIVPDSINWAVLTSVLLWSSTGWDGLSNFAGEVINPHKTYPLGIGLAMLLGLFSYLVPVITCYSLLPNPALWSEDAFLDAAKSTGVGSIVVLVAFSAILANLGQLIAGMAATSRLMWAMGCPSKKTITGEFVIKRTLPRVFGNLCARFQTPTFALSIQFLISSVIVFFDFTVLIQFEMLVNCLRLGIEFTAFIVLKYTEPDTPRAFVVPGGLFGAWSITLVKTAVLVFIVGCITASDPGMVLFSFILNGLIILAAYCHERLECANENSKGCVPFCSEDDSVSSSDLVKADQDIHPTFV